MSGYIVCDTRGPLALVLGDGLPPAGILMLGDTATHFATYDRARAAVKRTRKYRDQMGYLWPWRHKIYRLVHP